jgi:hypothetical protein
MDRLEYTIAMKRRGLKEQWAQLAFEKKLGIVIVPLLLAVISGLVFPVLLDRVTRKDDTKSVIVSPETPAALEVADVVVSPGIDPYSESASEFPAIDITLRNITPFVSVITRATFEVLDFTALPPCGGGDGLVPSSNYDVTLPAPPKRGDITEAKVSQRLPSNDVDRFTLRVGATRELLRGSYYIYQLAVNLYHDNAVEPLRVGKIIISVPGLPHEISLSDRPEIIQAGSPSCFEKNLREYTRLLALDGTRATALNASLPTLPQKARSAASKPR